MPNKLFNLKFEIWDTRGVFNTLSNIHDSSFQRWQLTAKHSVL